LRHLQLSFVTYSQSEKLLAVGIICTTSCSGNMAKIENSSRFWLVVHPMTKKNPSFQTLMSNIGVKIAANLLLHEGTP